MGYIPFSLHGTVRRVPTDAGKVLYRLDRGKVGGLYDVDSKKVRRGLTENRCCVDFQRSQ